MAEPPQLRPGLDPEDDPGGRESLGPATPELPAAAEPEGDAPRQLHPLPPGLVELYGLLAVLFVLVPEWMAGGALFGLRFGRGDSDLPVASSAWQRLPELRLATLNLAELRQLARREGITGYGRLGRQRLTQRLLKRLGRSGVPPKSL